MCLAGTVVACWSRTQEVADWHGSSPFTVMTNILLSDSVKTFTKNSIMALIESYHLQDASKSVALQGLVAAVQPKSKIYVRISLLCKDYL